MPALRHHPLVAASALTAGTLCNTGAGASGSGRTRGRWYGGEVGAGIAHMNCGGPNVNGGWFAAGAVAACAAAGGCGSAVAAGTCIYLTGAGAGAGANARVGVVLLLNLLLITWRGACAPSGGGSIASTCVT